MAGPAPKTQAWTARENMQGEQLVLLVSGQVQVGNTGLRPKLAEGGPLRDPHTFNLELAIEDSGQAGTDVEVWMPVSLQKDCGTDEYHDAVVRWDGSKIAQFPVVDDSEHDALMDKQSTAQNTVAKVVTKKPAAKKVAKKVAKKAAKTAAKKAVKKAAKKTAKKAGPRGVGGWAKGGKKKAKAAKTHKGVKKAPAKKAKKTNKKTKKAKGRRR